MAEAGIYEIGRQCDQYLDVLFRFNRNQRSIRQGLTATGAATATILGLAGVVAMPIAITAAAFGLAASLYDAGVNSVLFTIEPSALRNVVLRGRQAYIEKLDLSRVNSRPRMMIALQGYLTQCSPATIEANVNNAASGAQSIVNTRSGMSPDGALLGAPGVTSSSVRRDRHRPHRQRVPRLRLRQSLVEFRHRRRCRSRPRPETRGRRKRTSHSPN